MTSKTQQAALGDAAKDVEESSYIAEHAKEMARLLEEQALALGISDADVQRLDADLDSGAVSFQDILGLTEEEMRAMEARAEEHLRANKPRDALKIFFALNKLNRYEASYWRGSAICFHHLKEYGFAHGFYSMALATDSNDSVSEALRAECTLRLRGHIGALNELNSLLQKAHKNDAKVAPFLERARLLQQKLSVLPIGG